MTDTKHASKVSSLSPSPSPAAAIRTVIPVTRRGELIRRRRRRRRQARGGGGGGFDRRDSAARASAADSSIFAFRFLGLGARATHGAAPIVGAGSYERRDLSSSMYLSVRGWRVLPGPLPSPRDIVPSRVGAEFLVRLLEVFSFFRSNFARTRLSRTDVTFYRDTSVGVVTVSFRADRD